MPELLTADALGLPALFGPPQWGIFSPEGAPILTVDSVASVEYAREYRISQFPIERGGFISANKVQTPYRAKLVFMIEQSRIAFLNEVEAAVASLDLVTVATPEIQYPSANLTSYSYRREAHNGRTLIRVEVQCEQVRIINAASLGSTEPASTQSTNAATPTQSGQVQTDVDGGRPTIKVRFPNVTTGDVQPPDAATTKPALNPPT